MRFCTDQVNEGHVKQILAKAQTIALEPNMVRLGADRTEQR